MLHAKSQVRPVIDWWMPPALLLAFLLHNLEEALTFGAYRELAQTVIRNLISGDFSAPSAHAFRIGLAAVSLAATLSMIWANFQPTRRSAFVLVQSLAWIMLLNVALPHVPASLLLGGYAPGVVTAVFVNLPVAGLVLAHLHYDQQH